MDNRFWKIFTVIGLILAVIVFAMVLVLRFHVIESGTTLLNKFVTLTNQIQQSQQLVLSSTQTLRREIDLSGLDIKNIERMQQGCFAGNDCIPSIDHPKFVSIYQANYLTDEDLVIGVVFDDLKKSDNPIKAYPVKILNYHEVVNDVVNEMSVVVSYSPLTMSPRVFGRVIDGKTVEFGVSGMVLDSNLVMYDRTTDSLWNQFDGAGLTGPKRGEKLMTFTVPVQLVRWVDWVRMYPKTVVLSNDTGFNDNYDVNLYAEYEKKSDVYYPLEHVDHRLSPKDIVFGVVVGDKQKAYPETELQKIISKDGEFTDQFSGTKLKLTYKKKFFTVVDAQTNKSLPFTISYYFAWDAFYPSSEIYKAPSP